MSETKELAAPSNIAAEQGVLGAIMINNRLLERVPALKPNHFFDPLHAKIWQSMVDLISGGGRADPVTLRAAFSEVGNVGNLTSAQYLAALAAQHACLPASIGAYANQVIEMSTRRAMVVIGEDLAALSYDQSNGAQFPHLVRTIESRINAMLGDGERNAEVPFGEAAYAALEAASAAYKRKGALAGLPTGLIDLDKKMGGLQPSDLIVLAGRPAIGKTALATNIAVATAMGRGVDPSSGESYPARHVHFFSQEMSALQLAMRVISDLTSVSADRLRRGDVTEQQLMDVLSHEAVIKQLPMTIDETGGISLSALALKARRIKRRYDTGLIVVDYLQLMSGASSSNNANRVQEITAITTGLKALAKELDVPILALSQLSRKVEERQDKRPHLSDLRESGSIEQDADVVLFVYRDEYYLSREEPDEADFAEHAKWQERMDRSTGKAEVIIAKHRHAPTGIVELSFQSDLTRFSNLARRNAP